MRTGSNSRSADAIERHRTRWNPWPYSIMAFFALFIAGVASWIAFAARQRVDLVQADYYEQEIHYQRRIDSQRRTAPWDGQIRVAYHAQTRLVTIALPKALAGPAARGTIQFYRPADARLDREFPFQPDENGVQNIDAAHLAAGYWKVRLAWRARGRDFYWDQPLVIGGAG